MREELVNTSHSVYALHESMHYVVMFKNNLLYFFFKTLNQATLAKLCLSV